MREYLSRNIRITGEIEYHVFRAEVIGVWGVPTCSASIS